MNERKKVGAAAVAIIGLLVVSGGIYRLKHRAAGSTLSGAPATSSAPPAGASQALHGGVPLSAGGTSVAQLTPPTTGLPAPALKAPVAPSASVARVAPAEPAAAVAPAAPAEKLDQCVTITYHHKPLPSHSDDEACSHHKNMLILPQLAELEGARMNSASVCVRVNGTPVHYLSVKGHADELIFGSVAGPKSKVTVRYCTGKALGCAKEDCTVPKDEFMEAIGGAEDGSQAAKLGQWDPSAPAGSEADVMAKLDGAVKKELETNDDLNGRAPAGELFKDWISQTQTAACGSTQAKN